MNRVDLAALLAAVRADDPDAMLGLFTNPSFAVRFRFTDTIPTDDPLLRDWPSLSSVCAYFGGLNCLKVLAERGDRFLVDDRQCRSTCHFAVLGGDVKIIEFLSGLGLDFARTIFVAAAFGRTAILRHFADVMKIDLSDVDAEGRTVLHIALANGHVETAQFVAGIIDHGARDGQGNTPLAAAVGSGRVGAVDFVLGLDGVDPNPTNGKRQSIIHIAAGQQSPEVMSRVLKANRIGIRRSWDFMTMDCFALETEFGEVARASSTFDLNSRDDNFLSPFLIAVKAGNSQIVDILLDAGGEIGRASCRERVSS
jgi:ankyrin repeat protein